MWITRPRQELASVFNLENGHFLGIRSVADTRGGRTWEIASNIPVPGVQSQIVMDGYKTYEDAEEAFISLLSHLDISPFTPDDPTVDKAEETDSANAEEGNVALPPDGSTDGADTVDATDEFGDVTGSAAKGTTSNTDTAASSRTSKGRNHASEVSK
jgi:hypothetical protein